MNLVVYSMSLVLQLLQLAGLNSNYLKYCTLARVES
jgi:hypothetical protein